MRSLLFSAVIFSTGPASAASWDMLAGGVPGHDMLLDVGLGFAQLPRVSFSYGILNRFSLGASTSFDFASLTHQPVAVFGPALSVGMPMRIEAYRGGRLSFGIKLEPGLALAFTPAGARFGMILNSGFNLGYWVIEKFMVGGGIDLPITVYFTSGVGASIPILFGPIMEFHANNLFALGFDLKIGPGINTPGGVNFAMKLLFLLGFHFG